jgi:hypothetical protein
MRRANSILLSIVDNSALSTSILFCLSMVVFLPYVCTGTPANFFCCGHGDSEYDYFDTNTKRVHGPSFLCENFTPKETIVNTLRVQRKGQTHTMVT